MPKTTISPSEGVPFWRRPYIWGFTAVASAFVPVMYNFGVVAFIVPALWGVMSFFHELATGHIIRALIILIYFLIYFGAFLALAMLTDWIMRKIPWRCLRISFRTAVICGLIACSFARVLTYSSLQGVGGTYTFWTAVQRYSEKHGAR
ncbi:MAG: hypothetical protein ABIT37_09400 [Luteolibacter sp.]